MTTNLVDKLHKLILGWIGVKVNALERGYQLQLLNLFREADNSGCLVTADAIWDVLESRHPEATQSDDYVQLFAQVQPLWDAWFFYRDNKPVASR